MSSLTPELRQSILEHLGFLYGERAPAVLGRLEEICSGFPAQRREGGWSEKDALLITYGDQIHAEGEPPLQTLYDFLYERLRGVFSGVHLLPFYPSTSDDGFSVVDFQRVDPELGTWTDIRIIAQDFRLMADLVCNHVSASSPWFQGFLQDDPQYQGFFITVDPGTDLSTVFRPRALPLLTPFQTPSGEKLVWTTFSPDQTDLNYANPEVLLEVIEALLCYVRNGAGLIRLDAVGFIWKEIGTSCMHLEGAHRIVKLMRLVLDAVAPHVLLVSETNAPHRENISYFGNGHDEAQLVYQFPLPPLVMHTFRTGDASKLAGWAAGLTLPSERTTFFNFLASHDGIGVVPAGGILQPEEIAALVRQALEHGGRVNHKDTPDGPVPYELCLTLFDALSNPNSDEAEDLKIARFLAANVILLSLQGIPGVYIHSLFGSPSDHAGFEESGIPRRLNRHKFTKAELEERLADPASRAAKILAAYSHLLRVRSMHPAFHPNAPQRILPSTEVLRIVRGEGDQAVGCYINVTDRPQVVSRIGKNLITGQWFTGVLKPYQAAWIID
ncbi:alpha amylase catalytic region [Allomeiothermus silvanus DSM 9946]|uniref:Glucosylglycerate phosphorylase n=1 Tax=Allomeiothermus silvanus (strain ATCC 700542 / DSM 9946 / NBRC 106475 / NCIMB 13440 / VI-R2) TaxID=526227 RepID=GGAP_ALLS1|nr:sugar phosphorylase [Allomeiothermus silvanus]D7BAR0.1 RecName: Full=Glucosylglycerate phosphorylase; Short=GGa phosphorylase; Short=GGaP [Allomeiothermus silvanus DSM 9946]ADH62582.1 alpha amylase catalytic region [Allomeiothermus silvanus DSM 9946]